MDARIKYKDTTRNFIRAIKMQIKGRNHNLFACNHFLSFSFSRIVCTKHSLGCEISHLLFIEHSLHFFLLLRIADFPRTKFSFFVCLFCRCSLCLLCLTGSRYRTLGFAISEMQLQGETERKSDGNHLKQGKRRHNKEDTIFIFG